jgi:hypothetical protein
MNIVPDNFDNIDMLDFSTALIQDFDIKSIVRFEYITQRFQV